MHEPLRCVLDVSVSTKQFIDDPLSPKVDRLLDFLGYPQTEIFVPDLFYVESTNTLWKYVRAEILTPVEVQANLVSLKALSLRIVSTVELIEDAFPIAVNFDISAYDAAYVALSRRVNAPLLTLDKKLIKALAVSSFDVRSFIDFTIPTV